MLLKYHPDEVEVETSLNIVPEPSCSFNTPGFAGVVAYSGCSKVCSISNVTTSLNTAMYVPYGSNGDDISLGVNDNVDELLILD